MGLLLTLVLASGAASGQSTPYLVKDISTGAGSSTPSNMRTVGSTLYFRADDGVAGAEFWKTNGTEAGTVLLKDIYPGATASDPQELIARGQTLYFSAASNSSVRKLWKSDGTVAGTLVASTADYGTALYLTPVGSTLFFSGTDFLYGRELWKSATTGTTRVKNINPRTSYGLGTGSSPLYLTVMNSVLYFSANNGTNGRELWKSDGTEAGTTLVRDIFAGGEGTPADLTVVGSTLYFSVLDGSTGRELWKSDGSEAGTERLKDINAGAANSDPTYLVAMDPVLYFTANDGINGRELWKSYGTAASTTLVMDINSGPLGSDPAFLTVVDSTVYFAATDGIGGSELWKSDGTPEGTVLVKDINPGPGGSTPANLTAIEGILYFVANDGLTGNELWMSRGDADTTVSLGDIAPGIAGSNPSGMTLRGNQLLFCATDSAAHGAELWAITLEFAPPSVPGATAIGLDTITWTWEDNSSTETGFHVFDDPGAGPPTTLRASTGPDTQAWQHNGLDVNAQYSFQVYAAGIDRDSGKTPNYSAWTSIESVGSLDFSEVSTSSIVVAIPGSFTNLTTELSGVYITNQTAVKNSGWMQEVAPWTSSGLSPNTEYTFVGKSRNGGGIETEPAVDSIFTLAARPLAPVVDGPTLNTLDVAIDSGDGNPAYTLYAIQMTPGVAGNTWVQADGSLGPNPAYQDAASWGVVQVTGLAEEGVYFFSLMARNGDGINTAFGPGSVGMTLGSEGQIEGEEYCVSMERTLPDLVDGQYYAPYGQVGVTVEFTSGCQGNPEALVLYETIPPGWIFVGSQAGSLPDQAPQFGDSGELVFVWLSTPDFPFEFSYSVVTAAGGEACITGQAEYQIDGSTLLSLPVETCAMADPEEGYAPGLGDEGCAPLTTDQNGDWQIELTELLRAVQLFNAGEFHCDAAAEDGYAPGPGDRTCTPHGSDYRPQDWTIDASELLRVIQFFNSGRFHCVTGAEMPASPPEFTVTRHEVCYEAESPALVAVTLDAATEAPVTALALHETLPEGWTFEAIGGTAPPDLVPPAGATGTLDFIWYNVPVFPCSFSYTISPPPSASGEYLLDGQVIGRSDGPETRSASVASSAFPFAPVEVQIGPPSSSITNTGPVSFAVSYGNADSVTLSESDVVLDANGVTANVEVAGSGNLQRTIILTDLSGDGVVAISLAEGTASNRCQSAPATDLSQTFVVDNTPPAAPVITTDGGNGPGVDFATDAPTVTLDGTASVDTAALFSNEVDVANYPPGTGLWQFDAALALGDNPFSIVALDEAGNRSEAATLQITRLPEVDTYVSSGGSDEAGQGTQASPWRTIMFAMNTVGPFATDTRPITLHLGAETYVEKVIFASHVRLVGAGMAETRLQYYAVGDPDAEHAVVTMAGDTLISDLTLTLPSTMQVAVILLKMEDVSAEVWRVLFDGRYDLFSIGAEIIGPGSSSGVIAESHFLRLQYGIQAIDTAINIERNLFDEIGGDAVFTRPPDAKDSPKDVQTPLLGDANDTSGTGFNVFRNVNGFYVKNANPQLMLAENNDWGVYTLGEIQQKVSGSVDFEPWVGSVQEGQTEGLEDSAHTADQNGDGVINLTELLRVIQFFNIRGYHCVTLPESSEDGFLPGAGGDQSCAPHASDYNLQDWQINLTELLRLIQFFNMRGYHACPGLSTEDGFCPGLP
jgi:ELWxxDGT repeat protein